MTESQAAALRLAASLLAYPDQEFRAALPELRKAAEALAGAESTVAFGVAALEFIDKTLSSSPTEAAQRYVAIFDHTPSASLHMSWHRYGNDRSQGRAMAALNGLYRTAGFEPLAGDLPDYLPRMLEFLSLAPDWACEALLDGFGPETAALLETLRSFEADQAEMLSQALEPLRSAWPGLFKPRQGPDPTKRPMAQPEPEPLEPLIPLMRRNR